MANKRGPTSLAHKLLRAFLQQSSSSTSTGSGSISQTNTNAQYCSTNSKLQNSPPISMETFQSQSQKTMVVDVEGWLLKSPSAFPYFMVVALEAGGGGLLRGFLLLLLYPFICLLWNEMGMRIMVMVTFCGLRKQSVARVGRAILPKHLSENVSLQGFDMLKRGHSHGHGRVVCVSSMPRVMVEAFLREYLGLEDVLGTELEEFMGFYTGFLHGERERCKVLELKKAFKDGAVGFSSSSFAQSKLPFSYCKELLLVEKEEKRWNTLPRKRYLKPLIFHDGRLAFRPTPLNTLTMFLWLPFGFILALVRLTISLSLPYKLSTPVLAMTNMKWRLLVQTTGNESGGNPSNVSEDNNSKTNHQRGQLFVCNHRTLIDPIYISVAINRPVQAVCYSLSRVSEILSPISTVRLTRDREEDAMIMGKLLDRGESVVVCPEGTTCREPYLLRFSPLFTELSDEVVPVAVNVKTSMFYATTAGGWKCFDSLYYLMNASMCYEVQFLDKIDTSDVRARKYSNTDMANQVQRKIGKALGFQCTMLTRKDKYMMLAENDGIVGRS
ncbi:glycerol-3-phosphate acyltransferase 3 [Rhynchospora pubera]|uniref:Glycerol-3-phosphate acyltransferase 3 n=1 Tax=Rhynchospora pubera TaxID=906938 RepID=A0AAV8GTJ2_9POAL|nr:glycerol-3-phosphate acyltransferase 3 [Rhynchospora pubera]